MKKYLFLLKKTFKKNQGQKKRVNHPNNPHHFSLFFFKNSGTKVYLFRPPTSYLVPERQRM